MSALAAAQDLLTAEAAYRKAVLQADAAFRRYMAGASNASAVSRLENLANGERYAARYNAQARLWGYLPDVGSEETLLEAAHLLAGVPVELDS
jgi:hypothetical protein